MAFLRILWEWLTFKWMFRGQNNSSSREEPLRSTHNPYYEDYHYFSTPTSRSNHSGYGNNTHYDNDYDYMHEDIDDTDINDDCDYDY